MSLPLSCSCGARFEVEETFAGREVVCPECHGSVSAPRSCARRRTSGFAIASVILAVAGAFTVIGTVLAVILGTAGLVSIAHDRQRLAGIGYSVFAIVWGLVFTGLTLFAWSSGEVFNVDYLLRDVRLAGQVNYEGPLEVIRVDEGFAISRPTENWGVIAESPEPILWPDDPERGVDLTLINVRSYALVDVTWEFPGDRTMEQCQDRVLSWFSDKPPDRAALQENPLLRFTHFKLRHSRRLEPQGTAERAEFMLDVRYAGEGRTYLVRVIKQGGEMFVLRGWAHRRHFARVEPEIRKALDSFRLLHD